MADQDPGILSHVSLGTNDVERALAFYDNVLATLGINRLETLEGIAGAYGKRYPEFWVALPVNEAPATIGNGVHVSFVAGSREAVHAFYEAALNAGATDHGAPGPRPEYGKPYYGCFVIDLDGHKIEATFRDEAGEPA